MKKIAIFTIGLISLFAACSKEQPISDNQTTHGVVLKAIAEDQTTKATLNDMTWLWSAGDKIVVYYRRTDNNSEWNQQMNLKSSSNGQANGVFETPDGFGYDDAMCWDKGAIYPYDGNSIVYVSTNLYANVELKSSYAYEESQVLLPLVANMGGGSLQPEDIHFKQVASVVKVTLKDVPVGTKSVTLTADKTIAGKCNIALSDVGTGGLNAPYDAESSSVTFQFDALTAKKDKMVFYFPILPGVSSPKYTISLQNSADETYWSRTATDMPTLGRGEMLEMNELTIPSTKAVNIGVITYLNTFGDNLEVHHWFGSSAGDVTISKVLVGADQKTVNQYVGYWDDAQTFKVYSADIPITATHIRLHKGTDYNSYNNFGGDRDYTKQTLFIFEYSGTYHYDFH